MENHLVIHHIGGRSGSRSFPVLSAFEKDIINVMYDADESCLEQVTDSWREQESKTIVLPYCLSRQVDVCKFHINYDPYSSSIYQLNPRYSEFYIPPIDQEPGGFDYVLGDAFRTMNEIQLQTTTLDEIVLNRNEVPGPDFLSIDTQGSELDILSGALGNLEKTIVAIHAEIELHPIYEGQPLFGDICKFLAQQNFDLVDIQLFSKLLPIRGKQGFRGDGYVAHGEALFLKRPKFVTCPIQLKKLAFISTVYGKFECAQQCFESNNFKMELQAPDINPDSKLGYLDFILRMAKAVDSLPNRTLPLFSDIYSFTQSKDRFKKQSSNINGFKVLLKKITPLVTLVRFFKSVFRVFSSSLGRVHAYKISIQIFFCWRLKLPSSEVEALFLEFGMKAQFYLAMKNRIFDSLSLRTSKN